MHLFENNRNLVVFNDFSGSWYLLQPHHPCELTSPHLIFLILLVAAAHALRAN